MVAMQISIAVLRLQLSQSLGIPTVDLELHKASSSIVGMGAKGKHGVLSAQELIQELLTDDCLQVASSSQIWLLPRHHKEIVFSNGLQPEVGIIKVLGFAV